MFSTGFQREQKRFLLQISRLVVAILKGGLFYFWAQQNDGTAIQVKNVLHFFLFKRIKKCIPTNQKKKRENLIIFNRNENVIFFLKGEENISFFFLEGGMGQYSIEEKGFDLIDGSRERKKNVCRNRKRKWGHLLLTLP